MDKSEIEIVQGREDVTTPSDEVDKKSEDRTFKTNEAGGGGLPLMQVSEMKVSLAVVLVGQCARTNVRLAAPSNSWSDHGRLKHVVNDCFT